MAREIKFRAWDSEFGRWILPDDIQVCGDGTIYGDRRGEDPDSDVIDTIQPPKLILEQYTGLHDKNGREIYEGDIIKGYFGSVVVEYVEEDAGVYPFSRPAYGGYEYECENADVSEVLGNVHQNPELLNG